MPGEFFPFIRQASAELVYPRRSEASESPECGRPPSTGAMRRQNAAAGRVPFIRQASSSAAEMIFGRSSYSPNVAHRGSSGPTKRRDAATGRAPLNACSVAERVPFVREASASAGEIHNGCRRKSSDDSEDSDCIDPGLPSCRAMVKRRDAAAGHEFAGIMPGTPHNASESHALQQPQSPRAGNRRWSTG